MRLFRIAKQKYITDFTGEGARLYGGRWNTIGIPMLYFSEHLSLCMLEVLVHLEHTNLIPDLWFIEIEIPDTHATTTLPFKSLQNNWHINPAPPYTQQKGSNWIQSNNSLAMRVPAAVLPFEYNVLLNPLHPKINCIKIIQTQKLNIDQRLL